MAAATTTTADAVLKVRYPEMKVRYLGYEGNPLLSLLPKDTNFDGKRIEIPLYFGGHQGASRLFATAQTNVSPGKFDAFELPRRKDYGVGQIELELVKASAKDPGSFLRQSTTEIDGTIRTIGKNLAVSLYRNHGGARGQVLSGAGTATLTLKKIEDVVNFEVGMFIQTGAAGVDGTSGSVTADSTQIGSINRIAGTMTVEGGGNWPATFDPDDYLFRQGDFGVSINGLDGYLPAAAPSDTYLGVVRSVDPTRLGGLRYDGSLESIEEALISAEALCHREGAAPTHVFMNTADHAALRKSLGSKVVYDMAKSPDMPQIGFKGIVLQGATGEVKVIADRYCPKGVAYMLDISTWKFYSLGPAPQILTGMGLEFMWVATSDAIEIRAGYYGNLACTAPGKNMRVALPTV
jgi:hypothetical protein